MTEPRWRDEGGSGGALNLTCMCRLLPGRGFRGRPPHIGILVLVDVALQPRRRCPESREGSVGILVLVEGGLQRDLTSSTEPGFRCWNPCSGGSCSVTHLTGHLAHCFPRWNPCSAGRGSATLENSQPGKSLLGVGILVLLEVALQHSRSWTRSSVPRFRWNPCSVGSRSATRLGVNQHSGLVRLESLFCWKLVCNPVDFCANLQILSRTPPVFWGFILPAELLDTISIRPPSS